MRWMIRLVILGLAGYGAYRLYELLQPRAAELQRTAESQMHQVAGTARSAAENVRADVTPVMDEAQHAAHVVADAATS
jgi:hypothetical protein